MSQQNLWNEIVLLPRGKLEGSESNRRGTHTFTGRTIKGSEFRIMRGQNGKQTKNMMSD